MTWYDYGDCLLFSYRHTGHTGWIIKHSSLDAGRPIHTPEESFIEHKFLELVGREIRIVYVENSNHTHHTSRCECGAKKVGSKLHSHWCPQAAAI